MAARQFIVTGFVIATVVLARVAPSSADNEQGPAKVVDEKDKADKSTDEDKPLEPSLIDKLTKELLKEVPGESPRKAAEQNENKLEKAAQGMRTAGEKLDENQTGQETRKVQEQVIRDLDELIKQLQNPPPSSGGGGGGGAMSMSKSKSPKGQTNSRQQKLQGQHSGKAQAGQGSESAAGTQEKKVAEGSSERTESERKAAEEAARKKKLEMDVWGHLPSHLRDRMLNNYGERMLPRYQQMVKQFYESLSEQSESQPRQ
ncbi:MAG: hypothetical protein JSS49_08000 [Planctomycetes bacterium]|nr:hypothetical protein [Planctomycetota bacterium]